MAKKEGVKKMFDNIASDYDRLNHILSLNIDKVWRRKAVKAPLTLGICRMYVGTKK